MFKLIFWTCTGLVIYSYIGYFFIVWIVFKLKNRSKYVTTSYLPKVSIIISAYNEQKIIADKIKNCENLDYPSDRLEILLGLDGATDDTESIINANKNGLIKLLSFKKRRGKSSVLNDLVKAAQGDILVFSDANTLYDSDALTKLTRHFKNTNVGGVCGELVLNDHDAMDIGAQGEKLYWNYETKLKYLEGHVKTVLGANGAIYAIRKELYENLPEDKVIMDDFLIPLKVVEKGYRVLYDAEAVGREFTSLCVWDEFKRKIRIGAANFNALIEIKKLLNPKHGFIAFGLWSHKIIRWFIPFFAIMVFLTNIFLLGELLYNVTFLIQIGFLCMVLLGAILNNMGIYKNIFAITFYFFLANLALLIGFYRFIVKSQKPAWNPVNR